MTSELIIDCDPGIDDALALLMALGQPQDIRLLAVTCVAGNRPVQITAANARDLLDLAGCYEVPVYAGAAGPVDGSDARCNLVHGADGLGGVALPRQGLPLPTLHAVDYLVQTLSQAPPHSIDLVAIGPLTNLALAEARRPGLLARTRRLLVMGGAVACAGNVTPAAEFNFYADPTAAQQVLSSGAQVTLFGLDVTSKAVVTEEWIASLSALQGRCAQASMRMLEAYAALDPLLHDACPVAYLLNPELFKGSPWQLRVCCVPGEQAGHVEGHPANATETAQAVQVMFEVDSAAMLAGLHRTLATLP